MCAMSERVVIFAVCCICICTCRGTTENRVKKSDEPWCVTFNRNPGSDEQCTVIVDNQTFPSDVDQDGDIRVYKQDKCCILCMHNFVLANNSKNTNINVDSGLNRIASTTLKDILQNGLVDYEATIQNKQEGEIILNNYGQQVKYKSEPMVKETFMTKKLMFTDGAFVNLTQTKIVYDTCSSFNLSCTLGRIDYPLNIPQYCPENNGTDLALILGLTVGLIILGLAICGFCYRKQLPCKC